MKEYLNLENIHFKVLLLFLVVVPIWNYSKIIISFIMGGLIILDIIFFISKNRKKKRVDIIDIMFFLLPIYYLLPYIFGTNVNKLFDNIFNLFIEFSLSISLIVLRRYIDEKQKEQLLLSLITVSIIYFFISFIYQAFPKEMTSLGIISYFGDNYIGSVDRFYGTLDYCNSSALLFSICFFISLFKLNENQEMKYFYKFAIFINMLGFLITYSKMVSIDFILVSIVLVIYLIIRKEKNILDQFIINITSLVIPMIIAVKSVRTFLINLNIFIFFFTLILSFFIYLVISILLEKKFLKLSFLSYLVLIFEVICIIYFTINPISIPLKISNVMSVNDYIISDFVLEGGKSYNIDLDINYKKLSNVKIRLYGSYYDSNRVPVDDVIAEFNEKYNFSYDVMADPKYDDYYIRFENLNSKTDLVINSLKINGENYLINSSIIPYQFIHQLDLIEYDRVSVSLRFDYYKDSLKMLKHYGYVLGHGYNSFAELKNNYPIRYNEVNPHSYLFQLWLDTGLYGVFYILLLIIIGIFDMFRYRKCEDKILLFILFSLCMVVLPFDLVYSNLFVRFLMMLSFVLLHDKQ